MTTVVAETPAPPDGASGGATKPTGSSVGSHHRGLWTLAGIAFYVVLAVLAFLPAGPLSTRAVPSPHPGNPAGSDPFQMIWFLSWLPFALTHGLSLFHTNFFDYPQGVNLADNTSVPLLGLLGWPVTATLGPVATFNLLLRLAFALSATSMFLVLKRWCSGLLAPFLGGLLYGFGPYMTGQELHLDLVFVAFPPLLLFCADELVRTQRMGPTRLGILFGLAAGGQLLISPDVLSGCVVLAGLALVGGAIVHRWHGRGWSSWTGRLGYVARTAVPALIVFLLLCGYLIAEMVAGPDHVVGAVIPTAALQGLHADLLGTLEPTRNELLWPHFISKFGNGLVAGNLSENGSFLGLPLVVLLAVIARRLRRDPVVRAVTWLAVSAFVLSLGPVLSIANKSTHIPLPETVFAHIPLLDNTIPARYALYVMLFACVLLAIGVDRLWLPGTTPHPLPRWCRRLGPLGRDTVGARRARLGLVAGITVLSLVPALPFPSHDLAWPPALTKSVRRVVPPGSVILAYPYPTPLKTEPMTWVALAGMDYRLLGGYANIDFDHSGHRWPPLLSPPYVEELLGYTRSGDHWPTPPPPGPAQRQALYVFLARYSVGAVVYWDGGDNSAAVFQFLERSLGPPVTSTPSHTVAIWLPTKGHWPAPRAGS